jgi:hypothetical protein
MPSVPKSFLANRNVPTQEESGSFLKKEPKNFYAMALGQSDLGSLNGERLPQAQGLHGFGDVVDAQNGRAA